MTTTDQTTAVDEAAVMDFVFRAVDEVGAALNAALVVLGDKLGYYEALADQGPITASELARTTGTGEKYATEWLNAQAAGSFVTYDPESRRYTLPPEKAIAVTDARRPASLPGLYQFAFGTICDAPRIIDLARDGDVEQHALADPGLAGDDQHAARPEARTRDQGVQGPLLVTSAQQRGGHAPDPRCPGE